MAVNDDEWKALRGHVSRGFSRPSTVWTELKFKLMFSGWNKKDFFWGTLWDLYWFQVSIVVMRRRSSSGFAALCSFLDQNSRLTFFVWRWISQISRVWCIAVYCPSLDCSPSAPLVLTSPLTFPFPAREVMSAHDKYLEYEHTPCFPVALWNVNRPWILIKFFFTLPREKENFPSVRLSSKCKSSVPCSRTCVQAISKGKKRTVSLK